MKKLVATALLETFAVSFTLERMQHSTHVHGQTVTGGLTEPEVINEPVMPFAQGGSPSTSGHSSGMEFTDGGQLEQADWVWYSTHDAIPLGSVATINAKRYEVVDSDDWQGYSDVTIYYLKGLTGYGN
ncbi:hypothetical protein ACRYI5_01250 [Furfurilactobacillus sp. WILCCON 0119]